MKSVSPEYWQRIERLLDAALDLSSPEDRAAFLEHACEGDLGLRKDVGALLDADAAAGEFLEFPAGELAAPLLLRDESPQHGLEPLPARPIGNYRLIRELGHGGMGSVYLAERADGAFEQRVALKLVRSGIGSDELIHRFLTERQILARLQHPGIARLLDGGVTEDGQPFFAMEVVEGQPITTFCDDRRLTIDERLRLFVAVCDAVSYAHRNLVVHRDLKPSNILVTDGRQVKLLDFGIAKLLSEDGAQRTSLTGLGGQVMTPEYAAPEQVRGEAVTTATDVYALGVVLYELLTGQRPYRFEPATPVEIERVVCGRQPSPPSTAVTRQETIRHSDGTAETITPQGVSHARGTRPDRLRRRLSGDLDNIVLKALAKEPGRRYPSAEAIGEDLGRYLAGFPVRARPPTMRYRASRFVGRHRVGVAGAALVALALLAGLAGTMWQARAASIEAAKADEVKRFLVTVFEVSDPDLARGDEITARELLDRGADRVATELAQQPEVQAEMFGILGRIYGKLAAFDRAVPLLEQAVAWHRSRHGPRHPMVAAALSDLGEVLLAAGNHERAEDIHRDALEIRRARFGERHPEVARSLTNLAAALKDKGALEEAERLQREALAIDRAHYGPQHEEVATDLENLSMILRASGQNEKAESAARETLVLRQQLLGPDHLATATAMNNLALLLKDRGDLDGSGTLYRSVLAFDRRRLGEQHPYTAFVLNNLGNVLQQKGEHDEAERHFREALAIARRVYDGPHAFIATVLNNLGGVLKAKEQYAESEQFYREALAMFRGIYGEDHPSVGTAHAVLAGTLHAKGDYAAAEPLYREALERLDSTVGDHPRTGAALLGLGQLLLEQGAPVEAESLLRRALEITRQSYGDSAPRTMAAERAHAKSLMALGRSHAAGAHVLGANITPDRSSIRRRNP